MEQIQKLMFPTGSANRMWFDVATGKQEAPNNGSKEHGDKHREDVLLAINTMLVDPNPDSREIALNLVDLFIKRKKEYEDQLTTESRKEYEMWKHGSIEAKGHQHSANFSITLSDAALDT